MQGPWTNTGIGVVVDDDGMIFSPEMFATISNSQLVARRRFQDLYAVLDA